ncbi:MAG: carboxylating nicotinate-nucleotide diphosphorylase [Chloroflexi bacterium]|nr:carboxylating nicotinate-nucleotide diphosphorylase [Chloroflexota bacterium]
MDLPPTLPADTVDRIVAQAIAEDVPWGDITTDSLIPPNQEGIARIEARAEGVLAGLPVARAVFARIDPAIQFDPICHDGSPIEPGQVVARLSGPLRGLLRGERVALNFLQHLSGIATTTQQYVRAVAGTRARIVDTRKTTPGLRLLEKYAVRVGGGQNHRFSLSDAVLVKDNHLAALRLRGMDVAAALRDLRRRLPHTVVIEVEAATLEEVRAALEGEPDAILLDNMPVEMLAEAVRLIGGRALTEASGGINLQTVRAVAETGVDVISVGALTHSVRALDLALEVDL